MALSRRALLSSVAGAAVLLSTQHATHGSGRSRSAGRLLLGLTGPVYFNGFSPFLNWWKTASAPTIVRSSGEALFGQKIWDVGGYLDPATGDVLNPAPADLLSISRAFYKSANNFQVAAGCNYAGEEWMATWEGSAQGRIEFANGGGTQAISRADSGRNQIDFTTGQDPDRASLVLTLTDRNDPPRNIRIFQKRYLGNISAGEKFNPDWLSEIRKFGILRFMGWMPTNEETISEFSQLADEKYFAWGQQFSSSGLYGEFGPKGSLHPQLICELANLTGCDVHVCIPVMATDAFVMSFAQYFKQHTEVEVTYELSNECWNGSFKQYEYCRTQGLKIWPGDPAGFSKWYGYRSAQCMKIIRDVYDDTLRWRGALGAQTVDTIKTMNSIAGINYWRKTTLTPPNSLRISELFRSLYITGYFGFGVPGQSITYVTNSDPAIVTSKAHGFKNGQKIKLFIADGPKQLNERFVTVADRTDDTFALKGVSSLGMGAYLPPCRLATSEFLPQSPVYIDRSDGSGGELRAGQVGPLLIDGVRVIEGDLVLVKDQSAREQNGIYTAAVAGNETTTWRLVRASHFDRPSVIIEGSSIRISGGSNAGTVWILNETIRTVGRDASGFSMVYQDNRDPLVSMRRYQQNYAVDSVVFELADQSFDQHLKDQSSFPTKYTYFNQQVAKALLSGKCEMGLIVHDNVEVMEKSFWPRQLAIAKAYGLTLRQYEGNCGVGGGPHTNGNPYAIIYGGNAQFGDYVFNFGHSREAADVYSANYAAFFRAGGEYPAKFTADGRSSNAGPWAGVRFWPLKANSETADTGNPVWQATLDANAPR